MSFWKQISWRILLGKILRLFGLERAERKQAPALPAPAETAEESELPADLLEIWLGLASSKGVVVDTVAHAIRDWSHIREVMMGPGASTDAVDDVIMIANAEALLRLIMQRAPQVVTLSEIATRRKNDKAGRASAGDAILVLRDQGRELHTLASAALQWASSQSARDRQQLDDCAAKLSQ